VGPGTLSDLLATLPSFSHPDLLVSSATFDDAGVFRLTPEIALVQTVDFFTPMVDDPYLFGQIAAANALSDVYAMGGKPLTAMNIAAFPVGSLDLGILRDILAGGADKILEAGALLVGGHTVEDKEPKYGLAVTGTVHPDRVVKNGGARPGDRLILTKPLGVGIITTALKGELIREDQAFSAYQSMAALNDKAAEIMQEVGVNAATDITGFGFLGHLSEMCAASKAGVEVFVKEVPLLEGVAHLAAIGAVPGGAKRNARHLEPRLKWALPVDEVMRDILCDPQTSGGLLLAVGPDRQQELARRLNEAGVSWWLVGHVTDDEPGAIKLL